MARRKRGKRSLPYGFLGPLRRSPPLDLGPEFPPWEVDSDGYEIEMENAEMSPHQEQWLLRRNRAKANAQTLLTKSNPLVMPKSRNKDWLEFPMDMDDDEDVFGSEKPLWIEAWGPYGVDCDNNKFRLQGDNAEQAQKARSLQSRAGSSVPMQLDGWASGREKTYQYGAIFFFDDKGVPCQWPKINNRWLALLPSPRRYPLLVEALRAKTKAVGFKGWWTPPMLRMDFTQIVTQRVVRETMVLKKHPGIKMLVASTATRTAKANDCWKESEEISPLCPWCVEKATRVCYGVDTHACRGMLCARCLETFGRCPDCANWVGLPTTFV